MRITKAFSHAAQAIVEGALVALIVVGLVAGTALAGKGGHGGGGSTGGALSVPNGTYASTTTATAGAAYNWVHAKCSQGGTVVYEQWVKADGARHATFTLGPTPMWTSGGASCWAEDGYWNGSRFRQQNTATFSVSG
ncbi:MAG TPA: hypothetical protein VFV72_13905 [Candidatus Limnocylindrales bacterium]|nr:hypothetical protein [Candidatus Limnocylindrales bacterium]